MALRGPFQLTITPAFSRVVESRPREFHPETLAEPCGNLLIHTTPIVRTATFLNKQVSAGPANAGHVRTATQLQFGDHDEG